MITIQVMSDGKVLVLTRKTAIELLNVQDTETFIALLTEAANAQKRVQGGSG